MPRLSDLTISNLKPKPARYDVADSVVGELRVTVLPSGQKSASIRYKFHGRDRRLTLGNVEKFRTLDKGRIDIDQLRKLAREKIAVVAAGRDPQIEKVEARRRAQAGLDKVHLFGVIWDRYIAEYVKPNLKASTATEIERLGNTLILPKFKKRKFFEIAPHDIKEIVAAQKARGAPMQANKVFVTLRAFFNWARGELLLQISPCAGLQKPEPDRHRDRVLSNQEIHWFWKACNEIGFPFGPMNKLLLLTGARREEIRGMTAHELDRNARLFKLPGSRTKNGLPHEIHLADASLAVLDTIPRFKNEKGFLFSTNGKTPSSGFSRAKTRIDKLMAGYAAKEDKKIEPFVIHDLRRTVASGMAKLGIELPVIERALNHISGSFAGIVGVYQQHEFTDEKRAAFNAWASHVETVVTRKPAKVIEMAGRKRPKSRA